MIYDEATWLIGKVRQRDIFLALMFLEKYVNGTIIQWNRIQVDKRKLPGKGIGVDSELIETLFLDVHFYFVCYDKAQNLVHFLAVETCDAQLRAIWDQNRAMFKPYNDARNNLEHIETRITKKDLRDLGNMSGDNYTFGGQKFDVGAVGLKKLTAVYEKVVEVFKSWPPAGPR